MKKGFSLIEVLVVISLFAFLGIIISEVTVGSLRSARKADSVIVVRGNLDSAVATIERRLLNATSVATCTQNMTSLVFVDDSQTEYTYRCSSGAVQFGVTGSEANITSGEVNITSCDIDCTPGSASVPPSVNISVSGESVQQTDEEGAQLTVSTRVNLRSY